MQLLIHARIKSIHVSKRSPSNLLTKSRQELCIWFTLCVWFIVVKGWLLLHWSNQAIALVQMNYNRRIWVYGSHHVHVSRSSLYDHHKRKNNEPVCTYYWIWIPSISQPIDYRRPISTVLLWIICRYHSNQVCYIFLQNILDRHSADHPQFFVWYLYKWVIDVL